MSFVSAVKNELYPPNREGFLYALSRRESSSNLRLPDNVVPNIEAQKIHNRPPNKGFIGYFQVGEAALYDAGYFNVPHAFSNDIKSAFQKSLQVNDWNGSWTGKDGVTSKAIFLTGRRHQLNAINFLIQNHCNRLRTLCVNEFYGKTINGFEITESGCVAGAHLRGAKYVLEFLRGQGDAADAFDTKVSAYIKLFAHYDLETCCNRKIYITVIQEGKPVNGIPVKIESEYTEGKYFREIGKIVSEHKTNAEGKIPVIIRHPNAKIKITVNGKHMEIVQEANKKQSYTIDLTGKISVRVPLAEPSTPQPKPQENKSPQDVRNEINANADNENNDVKKVIKFNIQIVEADTGKAITNLRFYLIYKGKDKEHWTNEEGIKESILAEVGQDIEVCVAGNGVKQAIYNFKVTESLEGNVVKVPLKVHNFKLNIKDDKNNVLKNKTYVIHYRGRQIQKTTDSSGQISLRMLVGFVFGFGETNNKILTKIRCVQSIASYTVTVYKSQSNTTPKLEQKNNNIETKAPEKTQASSPSNTQKQPEKASSQPATIKQENTHTQNNGNPLTVVSRNDPPTSDTTRYHIFHNGKIERENKSATGFAEFIYYDKNGNAHKLGKSAFVVAPKRGAGNVEIGGQVYLVDQRKHTTYRKDNLGYKWTIDPMDYREGGPARRFYLNGLTLSGVLGTLMNMGYEEYIGTGWSNVKGESVGSSTHRNGEAGDFRYLSKNGEHRIKPCYTGYDYFDLGKNTKWVREFKKFGFQTFYTQKQNSKQAMIEGTKYISGHYDHLHLGNQGDSTSLIKRDILKDI